MNVKGMTKGFMSARQLSSAELGGSYYKDVNINRKGGLVPTLSEARFGLV